MLLLAASLAFFRAKPGDADAQVPPPWRRDATTAGLAFATGLIVFSTLTGLLHVTARRRRARRAGELNAEIVALRARLDRAELLASTESQIVVAWRGADDEPDIMGDVSLLTNASNTGCAAAFGSWLAPDLARNLEESVARLRARGEPFNCSVATNGGRHLDIEGRPIAGFAVMRIRDVGGERLEIIRLQQLQARTVSELRSLWAMLDAAPNPVWARVTKGASPGSTPPMRAPSKPGTRLTPSRVASSFWSARRAT